MNTEASALLGATYLTSVIDPYTALKVLCVAVGVYFLPTIFALLTQHHNRLSIFLCDLSLGWTMIGWVSALVWASSTRTRLRSPKLRAMTTDDDRVFRAYYTRFRMGPPMWWWRRLAGQADALMVIAMERGTPLTAEDLAKAQGIELRRRMRRADDDEQRRAPKLRWSSSSPRCSWGSGASI